MNNVYGMTPIDRSAALVTSQAGVSDGLLTNEQKRENLVRAWQATEAQLKKKLQRRVQNVDALA